MASAEMRFNLASEKFKSRLVEFEQIINSYRENKLLDKFKIETELLKDDFAEWKTAELSYWASMKRTERKNRFTQKTFELENDYLNHVGEAYKLILEVESSHDLSDETESGLHLKLEYYKSLVNSQLYLPIFRLPRFTGDKDDWIKFSNLFKFFYLDNKTLKDEIRFLYLKAFLEKGEAPSIEHFTNSIDAWQYLEQHYNALLNPKKKKNSLSSPKKK